MGGDPYAGLGDPVQGQGADPYANIGQPVIAHDITAKNGKVYRVLLNSEDQRAQLEQAINQHIDAGDPDLKSGVLPFNASVHNPAPPPAPVPAGNRFDAAGRELANGVTAGFGDKIAAAADAVIPLDKLLGGDVHSIWDGSSFGDAYRHNLGLQQGQTNADDAAHPIQSIGMNALGAVASPITKGAEAVAGLKAGTGLVARGIRALAPDAVYGATYGAGSSNADSVGGVVRDAAVGGVGGLAGSALGQGIARAGGRIVGGVVNPAARLLRDSGASTSIGQTVGGMANRLEAKATSLPILGDMIGARRAEAAASLINAPLNRALAPIKEQLPPNLAGNEALQYAQDAFDKVYAQARSGMSLTLDRQLRSDLSKIQLQAQGSGLASLSPTYAKQLKGIIQNDVIRHLNQNGSLDGDGLSALVSDLKQKAARYSGGNNPADAQEFGAAIKGLVGALDNAAARSPGTSPEARALKQQADRGYRYLVLAQNAAKRRGGDAGTVTAAQLDAAVQGMDKTARNNAYSRGQAFGQDLSSAGREVMPNVPNSFSADRYLMARAAGLASAGGSEELYRNGHPYLAAPLAVGALATIPYSRGGNALIARGLIDRSAAMRAAGPKVENALAPVLGSVGTVAGARAARRR